ncbi:MAG: LAGLIDADG family homing endonuclease [Candidatus Omnitrophota bacterium]|nr:LAGLIDADG family homing endonuclease [Candidatus Omnitrophota bacterium]
MPAHRKELHIKGLNLWYLVGLITSDGCLSKDGRHIDITSKDAEFLEKIKLTFNLVNKIGMKNKGRINQAYHLQIANISFYEFLLSVGLTPNKSLSLKSLNIPKENFCDFLRGLIDGDGCIRRWVHPSNSGEQWSLRIFSGSKEFIDWLSDVVEPLLKIRGKVHKNAENLWVLKYGKMAAKEIAKHCYYKNCLGLDRKIKLAQECLGSYKGWTQSKTVFN